ncbi:MAG: gliding motility-associated C-terminal domain-containing protein, partial [Saprospiraceae bacterium]|nr:gliding motility-associated C-terminal domain-containing protein [Saprospiraceae bacterium]
IDNLQQCSDVDTAVVTQLPPANVSASVQPTACVGSPVIFQADNQSPGDVVQYQWSAVPATLSILDPNSGNTLASGPAGQYTVTLVATNQAGCTQSFTFPVTILSTTNISALIDIDQACNSTAVTFDNNSGFPGTWNFGDGSGTSTVDSVTYTYATAGTYTVTFVSSAPCVLPFSQNLTVSDEFFTVTANDISSCDSTASLTASTNLPGTITWTNLAGNPVNPASVPPGTYIALGIDNLQQCSDVDTAVVMLLPPANVSASVQPTACAGEPITLEANNLNSGDVLQYQWSAAPAILTIVNPTSDSTTASGPAGQYTVTLVATNQAGCTQSFTFPVSILPAIDISPLIDIEQACNSTAVSFDNNSGFPGTWTFGDGSGTSTADSVGYTYDSAGVYLVTFVSTTACVLPFSQLITVTDSVFAVTGTDVFVCDSLALSNLMATTSLPGTISWTDLSGNPIDPNAVLPGTYIAVATNLLETCLDTDTVTVAYVPAAAEASPASQLICLGNDAILGVDNLNPSDILTYQWSNGLPGVPNPEVSPTENTSYQVTVTNQYGCSAVVSLEVQVLTVTVSAEITGKDTICAGQTTTLLATAGGNAGTYTYSWSPAETLTNPNLPDPIAAPSGQQTYTVTVTGDNLCTATDEVTVYFMETECAEPYIFVPKAFTPNEDGNNDRFRVRGLDISSIYFIVYDRWGEEVYRTEDPEHIGWDGTYKGKPSTPDSYGWYLRVTCGNGQVFESKGDVTLLK